MNKMTKIDFDMDGWVEARDNSRDLILQLQTLNIERDKYASLYFMDNTNSFTNPSVVETISPVGHNKVLGATRLLTSTSPQFALPKEKNTPVVDRESDKLEKLANLMWTRSNKIQGNKVERDLALTGFLFDEMQVQVISTRDLLKAAELGLKEAGDKEKRKWEGRVRAAEEMVGFTPYLFESINPMYGIGIRGRHGIATYFKRMNRRAFDVYNEWGWRAEELKTKKSAMVVYCEWWDEANRYVWVEGSSKPILAEPHGLSFIPIETITAEGSMLFDKETRQREPLLYGVLKSGIARSQSLLLTAMMTNVKELINAGFVFMQGAEGQQLDIIQHNVIGSVLNVPPGANIRPLMKEVLNADSVQMLNMINQLYTDSTLYDQALGQPVSGADNFSMVSLLAQAGRLPLIGVKEKMQILLSAIMRKAFIWLKDDNQAYYTKAQGNELEINPAQIPDYMEWEVTVEPDLPQDKMQMARLAMELTSGPNPLASKEWVRSNILQIGQSGDMEEQIWSEQAASQRAMMEAQQYLQMVAAKQQSAQQPTQPTEQMTPPLQPSEPLPAQPPVLPPGG
jgi:hypothetical protein